MNLYVSNLAYAVSDTDLRVAFEQFGAVNSARVIMDRETGRSRGFGFVEMPENHEGQAAIDGMNGQEVGGRPIKVVEARPKEDRPAGGGGGGGGGFRRGGGGRQRGGDDFGGGGGGGNYGGEGGDW
jgi:cold-inducible RNA-binding protein